MSGHAAALPDNAVLVHIGPHKTGTSALQSAVSQVRESLGAHGVCYPGEGIAHHDEARALRQLGEGWSGREMTQPPEPGIWTTLAEVIAHTPGRVLISSEVFAQADADTRAKLVHDLDPERTHIVVAARESSAMAVSTWQQSLRQGYPVTLDQWLEGNFRRSSAQEQPKGFWAFADAASLASRWSEVVKPDRITVVVLDERDRRLLPTTVERLLDLPEGLIADVTPTDRNRGLTAPEAALVRQIVEILDSRLSWYEYSRLMRFGVLSRVLRHRQPAPDEPKSEPPGWAIEQAAVEADRTISGLRDSGATIVGDLESLRRNRTAQIPGPPVTAVPLDLAAEAVVGAISVAAFGHWSLPDPELETVAAWRSQPVDLLPTRQLAAILATRLQAAARRRLPGRERSDG